MREQFNEIESDESENQRQIRRNLPDTAIVRPLFGAVARVVFPHKTALHLAYMGKTSERTATRWVSGEIDPPSIIYVLLWLKIIESRKPSSQ